MQRTCLAAAAATALLAGCGQEQAPRSGGTSDGPESVALPDVARVFCNANGAPRLETPSVRPQADGVHLEFVNDTGTDLSFSIFDPSGGGMGADAPQGTSAHVADLRPGIVSVTCYDASTEDGSEVPRAPLEIVDEDGIWVPTRLDCDAAFTTEASYTEDARGKPDPLEAAQDALDGYSEPGDVIEPAGYPQAEQPEYRLVRDGEVLAVVELFDDGAGGWLVDWLTGCSSLEP